MECGVETSCWDVAFMLTCATDVRELFPFCLGDIACCVAAAGGVET